MNSLLTASERLTDRCPGRWPVSKKYRKLASMSSFCSGNPVGYGVRMLTGGGSSFGTAVRADGALLADRGGLPVFMAGLVWKKSGRSSAPGRFGSKPASGSFVVSSRWRRRFSFILSCTPPLPCLPSRRSVMPWASRVISFCVHP